MLLPSSSCAPCRDRTERIEPNPPYGPRIQRSHALLRASDLAPHPSWAALAARHGQADQSHLIREVQHLAGVSLTRLHNERAAE